MTASHHTALVMVEAGSKPHNLTPVPSLLPFLRHVLAFWGSQISSCSKPQPDPQKKMPQAQKFLCSFRGLSELWRSTVTGRPWGGGVETLWLLRLRPQIQAPPSFSPCLLLVVDFLLS